jgi:hypothetical protein
MENRLEWGNMWQNQRRFMYRMIGADGQQYGPVSAEQLRRWLAENRVNAQTLIQPEGGSDWKPLGSFAEFADALGGKAPPPFSPGPAKPDVEALTAELLSRDYVVDIGSCFSRSWDLLLRHFWLIVGASFVIGLIQSAIGLLAGVCMGGLYYLLLKLIRGERAEFGDAFAGFSLAFLPLFLAGLVSGLLTAFGLLLCLVPGIYLAVAWLFVFPLVIDQKLEFWDAMELSRRVVSRHWWTFLGFTLVSVLVVLVGVAALCIGVYVAQPVVFGALAFAYEDIFGRQRARTLPAIPSPGA